MSLLDKLNNFLTGVTINQKPIANPEISSTGKKPIFNGKKNTAKYYTAGEMSDEQIQATQTRSKYITTTKNADYKVKSGDNFSKIAQKFGVELRALLAANGMTKENANLKVGQILKIPPTRKVKNINSLNDVAKSMGVSLDFIKKLKRLEDGNIGDNKFHNTPYDDGGGVLTIGVGHVLKKGESRNLTNKQVMELYAKDLLKMEDNIVTLLGSQKTYDKLPAPIKEALLDMVFNKGTAIIEDTPGLLYCLKAGKYEAAINKFTHNKNAKGQELSGLSKRRLFDISIACKMYNGNIPQSNKNTIQNVYNRGVQLLREECKKHKKNFANQLAGYNKDIQGYFGNSIKIKLVTS